MGKDLNGKELGRGLSQRADGRYEARAVVKGVKIDIYHTSLSELKKQFNIEKERIKNLDAEVRFCKIKLTDWYEEWFKNYKSVQLKSESSRRSYNRKIANTFVRILGEKTIDEIRQIDIQNATNELFEQEYGDRTVREALGVLRECLDSAVINKIITVNPCQQIVMPDKNECQKERRVLTQDEQRIFLAEVENGYYNEVYKFLLLTGVRIGELSGLQWGDIDFENKCVRINRTMSTGYFDGVKVEVLTTPKTSNSYRIIPFFDETESILRSWKKKQDEYKKSLGKRWRCNPEHGDLVFTSTMGSPVTRYVIAHDLKRVEKNIQHKLVLEGLRTGKHIEFGHLHPHCFRHTFATRCFEKSMDPVVVQAIMGHANYETTISYTHVLENKYKAETAKVGKFL